jgi:hypothetical protein
MKSIGAAERGSKWGKISAAMGGNWFMTERPEIHAELAVLGVLAVGCERPVAPVMHVIFVH